MRDDHKEREGTEGKDDFTTELLARYSGQPQKHNQVTIAGHQLLSGMRSFIRLGL